MGNRQHRADNRPPQAKKLKKEIGRLWKSIGRALEQGRIPAAGEAEKILRACADYSLFSEKEWQADWQHCADAVSQALSLAKQGDLPGARQAAARVDGLTKTCHRQHK